MISRIVMLLCSSLLFLMPGFAQKLELNFNSLTTRDGLSSNSINMVLKDRHGFLWVATEDGLNRFDGTNFKIYRHDPLKESSLKANFIKSIHEDSSGRLWIGTNGGSVSRYDRTKDSFVHFSSAGISKAITSICDDAAGNIWITSYNGLYILDPVSGKANQSSAYSKAPEKLRKGVLISVCMDSRKHIWIGTEDGLYRYDPIADKYQYFSHHAADEHSLCDNYIMTVAEDKTGRIWVGTMNGLSVLSTDQKTFNNYRHQGKNTQSISSDLIYSIVAETKERIWIGTEEGLDILNPISGNIQHFKPNKRDESSLTKKSIRSIYMDNTGICWLGTYQGGINKYDRNFSMFRRKDSNPFDSRSLSAPAVTSFAEFNGRGIFVGTDGGGLHLFNPLTGLIDRYGDILRDKKEEKGLAIMALEMTRSNKLWIGTYLNGAIMLDPATGSFRHFKEGKGELDLNFRDIFCIKEDRHGNIWIGTNGGGVNVYRPKENRVDKYVGTSAEITHPTFPAGKVIRALEEDRYGRIWIGDFGSGITVWDPDKQKFSSYNEQNGKLSNNYVLSILEDRQGNIWAGTNGEGLNLLNPRSGKFVSFSERNGLANGVVHKIVEDLQGNIWVSTNDGISRFEKKSHTFSNFNHQNGLQNSPFIYGAGICLADGTLYFGGQQGFNYFNPLRLKRNKNVPAVVLTDLKINNELIQPSDKGVIDESLLFARTINLKYKQNFSLGFVALNYTNPEQNRYEYKLHGFDKQWNKTGKEHVASYTNLDPGEYTFQVRACNNDGVWNVTGRSIKIIVSPPYWRTVYAYGIYLLTAAGILLFVRYRGIRKLKINFALQQERINQHQLIEQERKRSEYLRELDLMKIKFLTNLSHEFRTPISLIVGPVENLLEKIREPQQISQLQLIKRNGRRLLNLVNQLLDFRKMEEQELQLQVSKAELVSFVKEVTDSFIDLAERRKIHYSYTSEIDSFYTFFDADKIERILFNLLSNAFKFSLEGGTIRVVLAPGEDVANDDRTWLSITVCDTGIGISKDSQERIFDTFFQNKVSPTVLNQGTGIGLSIVREFVKMHGGHISVESEVGKGSKFTLNIPFTAVSTDHVRDEDFSAAENTKSNEIIGQSALISAGDDSAKPSILIVEDDEDFRFYLKDNLKQSYHIFEASNGKAGWQRALASHPDIIVSDVNMPIMDGIALGRKLKCDKRTSHIPLILLTASTGEDEQIRGLESGANDYMTKPFNFAVLGAKINNLLLLNRNSKATYSRQLQVLPAPLEITSENEKLMNRILVYIEQNLNDSQLSVEKLSKELVMSRVTLYKKILDLTGMTPVEFIRFIKLEKAAVLLETSDLNIAQIAYHVGFTSPNYFAKTFKDKYKITASAYIEKRRKHQL